MPKFEVYADAAGQYRWRLIASNGQKIASSGESFYNREDARRAAQTVKVTAPNATVGS